MHWDLRFEFANEQGLEDLPTWIEENVECHFNWKKEELMISKVALHSPILRNQTASKPSHALIGIGAISAGEISIRALLREDRCHEMIVRVTSDIGFMPFDCLPKGLAQQSVFKIFDNLTNELIDPVTRTSKIIDSTEKFRVLVFDNGDYIPANSVRDEVKKQIERLFTEPRDSFEGVEVTVCTVVQQDVIGAISVRRYSSNDGDTFAVVERNLNGSVDVKTTGAATERKQFLQCKNDQNDLDVGVNVSVLHGKKQMSNVIAGLTDFVDSNHAPSDWNWLPIAEAMVYQD